MTFKTNFNGGKLKSINSLIFIILILSLNCGCDSITSEDYFYSSQNGENQRNENSEIILNSSASPNDYPFVRYEIESFNISNDTFYLAVNYSGGCNDHEFGLVAYNYFMESFPVQVDLFLYHNDFDDACDGIISSQIYFDLTPLKGEYYLAYGNNTDPIAFNLLVDKINNIKIPIIYYPSAAYYFSFESEDDLNGWEGISLEMLEEGSPSAGIGKCLHISGGCIQPAASKSITITESGSYVISCWGKTNYNGGSVVLKSGEEEISVNITSRDWAFYISNGSITCEGGTVLSLELLVGGIVTDDLFCDDLVIRKL